MALIMIRRSMSCRATKGYTRPGGQRAERIRNFFEVMKQLPDSELNEVIAKFSPNNRHTYFNELVFENDTKKRPELKRFIHREKPKSLVNAAWEDLFEARDYDQTVAEFREHVLANNVPVICVRDTKRGFNLVDMQLPPKLFIIAVDANAMTFRERLNDQKAQTEKEKKKKKSDKPIS